MNKTERIFKIEQLIAARRRLRHSEGADVYRAVEAKLNVYAVATRDGCLVTVGRRDHRINRH
jgi:hypothetical protein